MTDALGFKRDALDPAPAAQSAESVLATKGRSFHWARHLLARVHANRATRLYHLCRYLDDLADEAPSIEVAQQALAFAAASMQAGHSSDPVIQDGLDLMHECGIDVAIVLDLIAGLQSDLVPVRMPDWDSLLRYCYQVAGTVGLMMCKVLNTDQRAAFVHAVDLGIAMQLTNICRDIATDAAMNRRYLPASMLGAVQPEALICPDPQLTPLLRACISNVLDRAEKYYQSGELGLSFLPWRARAGMLVAARVYREIGLQLRARDCDFGSQRVVVAPWRKAAITSRALALVPFSRFFWLPPTGHDHHLHSPLLRSRSVSFLRYAA